MQNTYHSIAEQILKLEHAKKSSIFHLNETFKCKFDDEYFQKAFELLKTRFWAVKRLFGDENFKEVVYIYLQTNPLHSHKEHLYGENFANFLASLEPLQSFYFVRFIAMLDWFWFSATSPKQKIQLPKGTLRSWGKIVGGDDLLDIELDESELEVLSIQKNGKEYKIIEH